MKYNSLTHFFPKDGVIVENMHDVPYVKAPIGPEIISSMTRICSEVKQVLPNIPCGLQVYLFKGLLIYICTLNDEFICS